eukprot:4336369-Prymnesium_polylepis.2
METDGIRHASNVPQCAGGDWTLHASEEECTSMASIWEGTPTTLVKPMYALPWQCIVRIPATTSAWDFGQWSHISGRMKTSTNGALPLLNFRKSGAMTGVAARRGQQSQQQNSQPHGHSRGRAYCTDVGRRSPFRPRQPRHSRRDVSRSLSIPRHPTLPCTAPQSGRACGLRRTRQETNFLTMPPADPTKSSGR